MLVPTVNNCKVGVIFCGGGGVNMMRDSVDLINPKEYPEFDFLGANTDANQLRDKFGRDDERVRLWNECRQLDIHQLGGDDETQGKGAGSVPEVGRAAAMTPGSMETLGKFTDSHDEIILVGAVGGGTGSGLLPVAAKICLDKGKSVQAIVVMPFPREGREEKASKYLKEIRSLVPTICIRNSYLEEYRKKYPREVPTKLGFRADWRTINEHSVIPFLLSLREVLQVPGDVKNLDQNDHKFVLGHGNSLYLGICTKDSNSELTAESVVDTLFAGHFQDTSLFTQVRAVELWVHGPWLPDTVLEVMQLIKERVCDRNSTRSLEIHWGMREEVTDDRMWMSVITASNEEEQPAVAKPVLEAVATVEPAAKKDYTLRKDAPKREEINILVEGKPKIISVSPAFARRYRDANSKTPESEWREILDEIKRSHNLTAEIPEEPQKLSIMEGLRNLTRSNHGKEAS